MDWMSIGLLIAGGVALDRCWLAVRKAFRVTRVIPMRSAERKQMLIKDGEL